MNFALSPSLLTQGYVQAMQKIRETFITPMWNFALFPSLLMQGYVQALQKIGETLITPMWHFALFPSLLMPGCVQAMQTTNGNFSYTDVEFCFVPIVSKYFRDAKYPLTVTKVYSTFG